VKWIHLNRGDEGLKLLFTNISHLLEENGIFILEYQPWKSYKNNRKTNQLTNENFKKIAIKPEQFEGILINEYHFEKLAHLGPSLEEAREYNRPILVLKKTRKIIDATGINNGSKDLDDTNSSHLSQVVTVENTLAKTKKKRIKIRNKTLESTAQHCGQDTILENQMSSELMKEEEEEYHQDISLTVENANITTLSSQNNNETEFHNQVINKKKRKKRNQEQSIEKGIFLSVLASTAVTTNAYSGPKQVGEEQKGRGKEGSCSLEEMKDDNYHNLLPVAFMSEISSESVGIKKRKKKKLEDEGVATIA